MQVPWSNEQWRVVAYGVHGRVEERTDDKGWQVRPALPPEQAANLAREFAWQEQRAERLLTRALNAEAAVARIQQALKGYEEASH